MQAGGGLVDAAGKPTLSHPANLHALELMQRAMVQDRVVALDPGATQHFAQITQGAYAAITGPAWKFSGQIQDKAPDTKRSWRAQALPTWDLAGAHASSSQGGTALAAPAAGKQVKPAVEFIVYAHTTTRAVLLDYQARTTYPTWRRAYADPALAQPVAFFGGQVVAQAIKAAAEDMAPFLTSPLYPKVNPLLSQAAQAVITGKQQPADALTSAQQQAEGIAAGS